MSATFTQKIINVREALNSLIGINDKVALKADKENTVLTLPTSNPGIEGALWNNAGVVHISSG